MFYIAQFDPYAPGAYAVQDAFEKEFLTQRDYANFALFEGELESGSHVLLVVAPSLIDLPATSRMAQWQEVLQLPKAEWISLVDDGDPWSRFGVPGPQTQVRP